MTVIWHDSFIGLQGMAYSLRLWLVACCDSKPRKGEVWVLDKRMQRNIFAKRSLYMVQEGHSSINTKRTLIAPCSHTSAHFQKNVFPILNFIAPTFLTNIFEPPSHVHNSHLLRCAHSLTYTRSLSSEHVCPWGGIENGAPANLLRCIIHYLNVLQSFLQHAAGR